MSYARKGLDGSDVYVWTDGRHPGEGQIHCQDCPLLGGPVDVVTSSQARMLVHLEQHLAAGHRVPETALARLRREWAEVSDTRGT